MFNRWSYIYTLVFIILFFFTGKEEQYDKFHSNKDKIFRIKANRFHNDVLTREMVNVCFAAGPEMKENFPEVERYVQMMKTISIVRHKEDWHKSEKSCYASEDFFKIFSTFFNVFQRIFKIFFQFLSIFSQLFPTFFQSFFSIFFKNFPNLFSVIYKFFLNFFV